LEASENDDSQDKGNGVSDENLQTLTRSQLKRQKKKSRRRKAMGVKEKMGISKQLIVVKMRQKEMH